MDDFSAGVLILAFTVTAFIFGLRIGYDAPDFAKAVLGILEKKG